MNPIPWIMALVIGLEAWLFTESWHAVLVAEFVWGVIVILITLAVK